MNFALPAILLFVVVLPGFLFRSRLKLAEQTSLDYSPFGRVVIEAFLWAAVLHGAWLVASYVGLHRTLATEALLGLLSSSPQLQTTAVDEVRASSGLVSWYFGTLYLFALGVPPLVRRAISHWRLDREGARFSSVFRFHDAPWYYLLTRADFEPGDEPDHIVVAAVLNVAGSPILYVGILADFFFDPQGQLDRLVLANVVRRPLDRDRTVGRQLLAEGDDGGDDEDDDTRRFYAVEGDYFVIRYAEVLTLNVHYVKVGPA